MTYEDVSSTAETQEMAPARQNPPGGRDWMGSAKSAARKSAFPVLFFVIGAVVALLGERLLSGDSPETTVRAFEDWRLVCPPAVAVPPAVPPGAPAAAAATPPPAEGAEAAAAAEPAAAAAPVTPSAGVAEIPPCSLSVEVVNQGGSIVALSMTDPSVGSRLEVTVPHGVLLEPGLGFAVGTEAMRVHPYETCTPLGCVAHVPVDATTLKAMQDRMAGQITVVPRGAQPVNIPFSSNGFAEGHAALVQEQARRGSIWGFLTR